MTLGQKFRGLSPPKPLIRAAYGWGKVVCWSTKAAISLKGVKIGLDEKLLTMEGL